jgi:hypothetical protein
MHLTIPLLAAFAAACGGSSSWSTGRIGPAGGALTSPRGLELRIPSGALGSEVEIQLREAEPRHDALLRVEMEPRGLAFATAVKVSVKVDDASRFKLVEIENEVEHGLESEHHDQAEHAREGEIHHLGVVELRHAAACSAQCAAGLECDDGVCKPHEGAAPGAVPPNPDGSCPAGLELDDGVCKPHGGAVPGAVPPNPDGTCPAGLELDDGVCKPHGGGGQG